MQYIVNTTQKIIGDYRMAKINYVVQELSKPSRWHWPIWARKFIVGWLPRTPMV